ncbi:hypothetical protein ACHQM5_020521 [Ranunculus cassubicifolius]
MQFGKIQAALESCKSIKQAYQIHAQIILQGLNHHTFYLSRLISLLALSGSETALSHSRLVFSKFDQPNIFIWNTIIRGYSRSDFPLESLLLFKSMLANVSPNNYTFPFVINSCAKLSSVELGKEIHGYIMKIGYELDLFVRNALIHLYSSFGYLDDARQVFDECCQRDCVSFNTMINGYARHGRPTVALDLFVEMQHSDVEADAFTMVALLSACSVLNDPRVGKQIHLFIYKKFVASGANGLLYSALVDMYAKCSLMEMAKRVFDKMGSSKTAMAWSSMVMGYASVGDVETARCIFDQMPDKDLVSWTIMINGYTQTARYSQALELFVQMEGKGLKPDEITIVSALSACAKLGALDIGKRIHRQYIKCESLDQNLILTTAVVDMYAKCGSLDTALSIFYGLEERTKTTSLYNVILFALAQHGDGEATLRIFEEMQSHGLKPDGITFIGILCACSHGGLVEDGQMIFDSMSKIHGIEPQPEHYCCLIDLLGRSGHVKEAYDFIKKMPFEANSVIWRSLLGSCNIHGNIEMGQIAAEMLLELDPNHGAGNVVLSNILTNSNRWEDAGRVRQQMEDRGIPKPPGWSYIEVNGTPHRFQASDKSHAQTKEIEAMLEDMGMRMKTSGYVVDTRHVLFDLDEEEKQSVVSYHSEKLALAFGLISLDSRETIRIVKNLRICRDCHSAFKFCSEIYGRDVLVRDTIRFHHFKNGSCSCKDFW